MFYLLSFSTAVDILLEFLLAFRLPLGVIMPPVLDIAVSIDARIQTPACFLFIRFYGCALCC